MPLAFKVEIPSPLRGDIWIQVRLTASAVMSLATFAAPTGTPWTASATAITLHNMTPETAGTTHYFYCGTRPFLTHDVGFTEFLRGALEVAFAKEDKPMLEKQQVQIRENDFWSLSPVLLSVDAAVVCARRTSAVKRVSRCDAGEHRRRTLAAAEDLFLKNGYAGMSLSDIIRVAGGLTPSRFYAWNVVLKRRCVGSSTWRSRPTSGDSPGPEIVEPVKTISRL